MVSLILILSIGIQFLAAFTAFYHLRSTARAQGWMFIAFALLLMGARRSITLAKSFPSFDEPVGDLATECVALVISLLMLIGVWMLGRFLRQIDQLRMEAETNLAKISRIEAVARANEENLRVTLESIGDAVIATDCKSRVVRMNKMACTLTGCNLDESRGRYLTEVFNIVNAHTREPIDNPVKRVLADGRVAGLANHTTLLSKDGQEYQISDSAAPIHNDAGETIGVVLVFRSVTNEKQTEEKPT